MYKYIEFYKKFNEWLDNEVAKTVSYELLSKARATLLR